MAAGDVHPIVDEALANSSYLVDVGHNRAVVVDPRREADEYVQFADRLGVRVVASLETHLHADFVSGSRELAEATGAAVVAPAGAELRLDHRPVSEGDTVTFGDARFEVLHTPGHATEHVTYLLSEPVKAVFSGGSLIAGGAARTDLTGEELTLDLARAQYHSLGRIARLDEQAALFPTHGAGSFCSTVSGVRYATTIGDERRSNPLLQLADEDAFVDRLLVSFGGYPPYFLHLRDVNRRPALLEDLAPARPLSPREVSEAVKGGAWLVDGRPVDVWAADHPKDSISIAVRPQFASWLGWVVPFAEPILLLVGDDRLEQALRLALRIGYDQVLGWLDGGMDAWHASGLPTSKIEVLTPEEAGARADNGATLLDVRQRNEWMDVRIPGALHLELGEVIAGKHPAGELITFCGHGERAATAASLLSRDGGRVATLAGGFSAWERAGLPVER